MKKTCIKDIDKSNAYFHFTDKENLKGIEREGLIAKIGDASKIVKDKPRVCLSQGIKGILGIKNSFVYMFKHMRICDIPDGYKKYFDIVDFSSTELISEEKVYEGLKRKFENEIYLVVDAKEGEDFEEEETYGLGSNFDIKGKENHNISPRKISRLCIPNVNNAWETITYLYNEMLDANHDQKSGYVIRYMNSSLDKMITYFKEKGQNTIKRLTIKQRIARFLQKNKIFVNLSFVDKFIQQQLSVLTEPIQEKNEFNGHNQRESFMKKLSDLDNYGDLNLPNIQELFDTKETEHNANNQNEK